VAQGGARCGARRRATARAVVAKTSPVAIRCIYYVLSLVERRARAGVQYLGDEYRQLNQLINQLIFSEIS